MSKRKKLNTQKNVKSNKVVKQRDPMIIASLRGEIKMNTTCTTPNKRAYKRKQKHNKCWD